MDLIDPTSHTPAKVDTNGALFVNLVTGEFENEEYTDDSGIIFVARDVGTATGGPVIQTFIAGTNIPYTPANNPRPLLDGPRQTRTVLSAYPLSVQYATPAAGGAGYKFGDRVTVAGGTYNLQALGTVTQVDNNGAILAISFAKMGSEIGQYSAMPTNPASVTGGSGTGATLTITSASGVGFMLDTIGFSTVQWLGSVIQNQSGSLQGSFDMISWFYIPFLEGVTQTFFNGSCNSAGSGTPKWISSPTPFVRYIHGSIPSGTSTFYWAQRQAVFSPATETVNQGASGGSNNLWGITLNCSAYGPPQTQTLLDSAASTNVTLLGGSTINLYGFQAANSAGSGAWIKFFLMGSATAPTLGTTTPIGNYYIPPTGNPVDLIDRVMGQRFNGYLYYAITAGANPLDSTPLAAAHTVTGMISRA